MRIGKLLFWGVFLCGAAWAATKFKDMQAGPPSPESLAPPAPDAPPFRALFIGNSLTYSHGMPEMLVGLARTAGINLQVEQRTAGGARLMNHAANPDVLTALGAGGWNVVVLQEQSQWPGFSDAQVRSDVDPYAARLVQRAREGSPGVRLMFYMTPAMLNGDPQNAGNIPELGSYEGMQRRINTTYRRLARLLDATVVPAGVAWQTVRREQPALRLYEDDKHPNREGAYLVACTFFAKIFNRSPVGSAYTAAIPAEVASLLQRAAWQAAAAEQ